MLCCLCYFLASLFCSLNLSEYRYCSWLAPSMRTGIAVPSLAAWCLTGSEISFFFSPYFLFQSFLNELVSFPSSHYLFATTYLPSEVLFWLKFPRFHNSLDPNRKEYFSRKAVLQCGNNSSLFCLRYTCQAAFLEEPRYNPSLHKKI